MSDENKTTSLKDKIIEGSERGEPSLKIKNKKGNKLFLGLAVLVALGMIAFFGFFGYQKYKTTIVSSVEESVSLTEDKESKKGVNLLQEQKDIIAAQEIERKKEEARLKREQEEAERLRKLKEEQDKLNNKQLPPPSGNYSSGNGSQQRDNKDSPEFRKMNGNILMSFEGSNGKSDEKDSGAEDGFDKTLKSSTLANGSVYKLKDMHYLLSRGTSIPCVLITKIITDYKGLTTCQLTKDVYSYDGTIKLLEKGSKVFGEQRTAMVQGKARVFINWTTVRTKHGINVRIDSLGTDSLGAAGNEGWVDTHFKERFGGAIMLSFIQDAFATASNMAKNSSDVTYDNSSSAAEDMASEALKNSINIPPTAYVNQGEIVHIHVARDIDFSEVYYVN